MILLLFAFYQVEFIGVATNGVSGVSGLGGAEWMAISPDDAYVYTTGAMDNSLAVFSREVDGSLSFLTSYFDGISGIDGLAGAQGVAITPDGLDLYVTGSGEDKLAHFRRDLLTGSLTFIGTTGNVGGGASMMLGPVRVLVDPSGTHLYISCVTSSSIIVYRRDPVDGLLSFVEEVTDNSMGFDGLQGVVGMAMDPLGKFLFAGGSGEDSIASLARDETNGTLTFLSDVRDGVGGIDGIAGINDLSLSGRFIAASGFADNGIALFRRDTMTGALVFLDSAIDGVGGVDGLAGVIGLAFTPNGKQILAAGFSDNALAVFERTGMALTFRQVRFDGADGVDGLAGSVCVAVSSSGKSAYLTGFNDASVAQFRILESLGTLLASWSSTVTILELVDYVSSFP